jgi:hypothetical protein
VTASVVVIAVSRGPSNNVDDSEPQETTSFYSEMEPSLNFTERWGDTEFAAATSVEDFVTGSLTKTVRTVSFVRPPVQAAAVQTRPAAGFQLASADTRAIELHNPNLTDKETSVVAKVFDDEVQQYLWEVYERMPTKKDGSGDFTWKDPAAAKRVGMSLPKYVISGMDPDFREQLYHAGKAMDADGLRWSILSAFRDDYRQRIASGIKASGGNSLHGGSRRTGGYGHGRAVDMAAADDGDMSDVWHWIDKHGAKYGLYRPMPGYDPAHIQSKGEWRKLAASLRQARIKEEKARARAVSEAAEQKASHVASADNK